MNDYKLDTLVELVNEQNAELTAAQARIAELEAALGEAKNIILEVLNFCVIDAHPQYRQPHEQELLERISKLGLHSEVYKQFKGGSHAN